MATVAGLLLLAAGGFTATAVVVSGRSPAPQLNQQSGGPPGTGPGATASGQLPNSAAVPAADLVSDPVFVTDNVGFALATTERNAQQVERLARSVDGGRNWYVTGGEFPVSGGFSTLEFLSDGEGFVFGAAGLVRTSDSGARWHQVEGLGGQLQKVIPIGQNVWATFISCTGAPDPSAPCPVEVAISTDGGTHFARVAAPGIEEATDGGDILARVTETSAYLLSYGSSGGGLAYTADDGQHWVRLADPCAGPSLAEDLAAPEDSFLWLICGAGHPSALGEPKSVYQSADGGRTWRLRATTGLTATEVAPVGEIPLSGSISQLATITRARAWLGLSGVGVVVTFDAGRTWKLATGLADIGPRSAVGVTFNNGVDGWAVVFRHGVWRTTDAVHWRLVDGG